MSKVVRAVRFEQAELDKIDQFLKKNPFLDFSTLTRMAIGDFIKNPTIQIQPIKNLKRRDAKELGV